MRHKCSREFATATFKQRKDAERWHFSCKDICVYVSKAMMVMHADRWSPLWLSLANVNTQKLLKRMSKNSLIRVILIAELWTCPTPTQCYPTEEEYKWDRWVLMETSLEFIQIKNPVSLIREISHGKRNGPKVFNSNEKPSMGTRPDRLLHLVSLCCSCTQSVLIESMHHS